MDRRNFLVLAAGGMAGLGGLQAEEAVGPVTHLPIPRYVSLKSNKVYARRGPALTQRIDWVYTHAGMPVRVTGEFDHWRRIEDEDGLGGDPSKGPQGDRHQRQWGTCHPRWAYN